MSEKRSAFVFTRSALSLAIAASLSGVVMAAAEDQTFMIEEIVVTAQKKAESMQDTPIAISAFTGETLEKMGIKNAADVGNYTPNATISPSLGSKFNVRINIRGQATAEPSLTIDPKVGIYLDGAYIARNSGAVFDIVDLERIEVLRGPQGTLWGKNTTGGAVNMVTSKPKGEFGFKQQLTAGNFNTYRSVTTVDTPTAGNASAKLTYMLKGTDGWATNYAPGSEKDLGSEDTEAYRIAARWDATDSFSLDYAYDRTNGEAVAIPVQVAEVRAGATVPTTSLRLADATFITGNAFAQMATIAEADKRLDKFNVDYTGKEHVDISGHNLTASWDLDAVQLKSITAYREYDSVMERLNTGGGAYTGTEPGGNVIALPAFHSSDVKSQHQFSQEFQFLGSALDGQLGYIVGLYYFDETGKETNPWKLSSAVGASIYFVETGVFYETTSKSNAVFGQVDYNLTDQWNLVLGLRHTEDEKSIEHRGFAKEDDTWSKSTGSFTANYEINNDMRFYGKVSQGYNAGVYSAGPIRAQEFITAADPEELTSYELGMKSRLMDGRVQLNGALFYNDADNLQATVFKGATRTRVIENTGKSDTQGIELDVVALLSENVMINASYGYLDEDFDEPGRIQVSPKNTASLGGQYDYYLDFGLLTARLDASYSDEYYLNPDNRNAYTDARTLLNARLSLSELEVARGNLSVALWGTNLTDEEYRVHGTDFGDYIAYSWGDPRTYGVDVSWQY